MMMWRQALHMSEGRLAQGVVGAAAVLSVCLFFLGVRAPSPRLANDLDALVDPIAEEALRSGPIAGLTVGISRDGQQVFAKGYGLADLENAVGATPDTVYRICSTTKGFTATAILQLRDQHKLDLDDQVGRLLPDVPAAWRRVNIRQILTHTGGLPNYHGKPFRDNIAKDLTPAEWVRSVADQPLMFEPGSGWSYSNVGYDLLGLIIEKLSGASYGDYIRDQVTAPLGLEHTRLLDRESIIPHRAHSYTLDSSSRFVNAKSWGTFGVAGGGLGSTVADLLRWESALKHATIISRDSKRLMESPARLAIGLDLDYGFGTRLGTIGTHGVIAHSGDGEGWTSGVVRVDDADLVVVGLANTETYARHGQVIASAIARRVLGLSDPDLKDLPVPAEEQLRIVGAYQDGLELSVRDGRLFIQLWPGAPRDRLLYQGDGLFVYPSLAMTLKMVRDQRGGEWVVARVGGVFILAAERKQ
jgi:CubicO group peptidase (beta-lactamase class C family)